MPDQKKYTGKLANARILIIGGSSGMGYGVAEASIEHGATVIVSSSSPQSVQKTLNRLETAYPSAASRISGFPCNLGDETTFEANMKNLFDSATSNGTEKLDHVVYSAADPLAIKRIEEVDFRYLKQAGMLRFYSPILIGGLLKKYVNSGTESSYTITSGSVSQKPHPNWVVIGSYATGLHGTVRGLALDLAPIRVNGVVPGAVDTEMWPMKGEARERVFETVAANTTTGSIGQVQDVAEAYLYSMKDKNVTGTMIATNGGSLLK